MKYVFIYYGIINFITFVLYGIDKQNARNHKQRISEANLLMFALMGGAFGALIGMKLFHHKTKHAKFLIFVPFFFCVHIAIILYIIKEAVTVKTVLK